MAERIPIPMAVSPTAPAVTVVIPCRNEQHHIERCLRDVLAQTPPLGGFEVIVADGMSDDDTRAIVTRLRSEHPTLRLIDNPRRIVSTGLNQAIRLARGEVIVRMDAHTEYSPDYVRKCVSALESTGADNVGGAARTKAVNYMQSAIGAAYHCPLVVGGARFHNLDYEGYADTVVYGCWRRNAFERFGYFDEELIRNQDDEFNLRITRNGGRVWQSAMIKSWYYPRSSLCALFKQYSQYGYWKVRVIQKHHLPASWRHLVPGAFLLALGTLGMLALFSLIVFWIWLAILAAYAVLSLTASLNSARRSEWKLLPVLPAVVGCYHFGYGYGFCRGLWDFVICRKGGRPSFGSLTRIS